MVSTSSSSSSFVVTTILQQCLSLLVSCLRWLISWISKTVTDLSSRLFGSFGPVITLDTGRKVRLGRQIAQGGFSFVFEATPVGDEAHSTATIATTATATTAATSSNTIYALKRIQCPDAESIQACRREAAVHRSIGTHHPNILPLWGLAISVSGSECYMLFPYLPHSLRAEVNRRLWEPRDVIYNRRPPWTPVYVVLQLFLGICHGVQALHEAGYSHRDVKLENVLLANADSSSSSLSSSLQFVRPVLMDFGSAGPLSQDISTRRQVLQVIDSAAQHTTMSYRPPELFEGGVRAGDPTLDYTKVDVWSLGCTLFAMLYGASPLESEFYNNTTTTTTTSTSRSSGNGTNHSRSLGPLKIVDCTHLKVLATLPPRPPAHSPVAEWYDPAILTLLGEVFTHDRQRRPTLPAVMERVTALITQWGGRVDPHPYHHQLHTLHHASAPTSGGTASVYGDSDHHHHHHHIEDDIALLSANRLV